MNTVLPVEDIREVAGPVNTENILHQEVKLMDHNIVLLRDEDLDQESESAEDQKELVRLWIRDAEDLDDIF